jgi:hypothetical protein
MTLWTRPVIEPAEAVAIALSVAWQKPRAFGPHSGTVALVLSALEKAGWKIVPREDAPSHLRDVK